ncbi:uncharacterized protein MELLADRAFT_76934 [Melampsora larici-populina 98AG31]|uniref:Uncharacterized protein n=1 Tax=Melampsora larici-populina (strain 98AG31 / pathotype 3-4-7) TaxID=747676 RepID=F4RBI4_MELLP|nr:uncharacterized protein MELLADRAFT_76934 [Melampsora larici-populina 98AG31]EGG10356.1 hypothetical protein MELLADRAFT_76934 [Melampsora larici-populina 98AG31]
MAPRTRKKGVSAASKSSNQRTQAEDLAPGPINSNTSTRATLSKRPPQAARSTNRSKRVRNNTTNPEEPSTNDLSTGAGSNDDQTLGDTTNQPEILPTLDNYMTMMKLWPLGRIREHLEEHKASTQNRLPSEIHDRVKLVYNQFKNELLMLAMIGKVSEATIKSYIPEMSATRAISRYTIFLQYCLDCLSEPMPLRGQEEGGDFLGDRNWKTGARWRALSDDEKAVFEPINFYALAGVPNLLLDPETGECVVDDHPEEQEHSAQLQRKSKTAIEKIAHQLSCEANRLDFAYYLVATSTVTPNKSSELGWLKQYTTHPQIGTWANKTCHFATVFATYSQGVSMAKAIASVNNKPKRQRPDKQQPSDKIKVDLGRLLAALTHKTLGYTPPQSFPQTADPAAESKKRVLPISIVLTEGSRLTDEKLQVGFKKMQSATRNEWLNDVKDGHFRLTKLRVGSDEAIGEPVVLDATDIEAALTTPPRARDNVIQSNNNSDEPITNQAANNENKKKNGGESDTTSESDSDEEDD